MTNSVISMLEGLLWCGPLLFLLMGSHVYFTIKLRGIQRLNFRGIRLSLKGETGESGVSAFGALATSLAAAIGTGNIVGIATAVALGGPGAVFWCWMTGLLGMATRYAETVVCLLHPQKQPDGSFAGGPMYVMEKPLGMRHMGKAFAVLGVAAAVGTGALIQANAAGETLYAAAGIPRWLTGMILTAAAGAIILGGVRSIASACEKLVPAMSALYLLGCLGVMVVCRDTLLPALGEIVKSAVAPRAAGGGFVGSTILTAARYGTARGLFTNEAGMGTAPLAAAAGPCKHPAEEALISMTGVFWDTVVICAMTGLSLVSAMMKFPAMFQNAGPGRLCFLAFSCLPFGKWVLTISLAVFAFATVVGWSYYGECCCRYLWGEKSVLLYRLLYLGSGFLGVFLRLEAVWSLGSILSGLMTVPNLAMLFFLRKEIADSRRALKTH